tara:strand:+ start:59 stop:820 length:762 start_codon:yes stop_codon:yes gene_type:complete
LNREQQKAMFANKNKLNFMKHNGEKFIVSGKNYDGSPRMESLKNDNDAGFKSFKESEGKRDWEKRIDSIKTPNTVWKKRALQSPYLDNKHKEKYHKTDDELKYNSFPNKTMLWKKIYSGSNEGDLSHYASMYYSQLGESEKKKLAEIIKKISPKQLELLYLDHLDSELQVQGHNPVYFKEGYGKNIPREHWNFINEVKNGKEMIRRVHILKRQLGAKDTQHPSYWDSRYRKHQVSNEDMRAYKNVKPSGQGYF